jgi:hypothetical protein
MSNSHLAPGGGGICAIDIKRVRKSSPAHIAAARPSLTPTLRSCADTSTVACETIKPSPRFVSPTTNRCTLSSTRAGHLQQLSFSVAAETVKARNASTPHLDGTDAPSHPERVQTRPRVPARRPLSHTCSARTAITANYRNVRQVLDRPTMHGHSRHGATNNP